MLFRVDWVTPRASADSVNLFLLASPYASCPVRKDGAFYFRLATAQSNDPKLIRSSARSRLAAPDIFRRDPCTTSRTLHPPRGRSPAPHPRWHTHARDRKSTRL